MEEAGTIKRCGQIFNFFRDGLLFLEACEVPRNGHYICNDDGELKCLPGYTGDLCDVPICRKGCDPMQGYCKRPGECRCKLGFYGPKCDKCIPLPGCQHGGCNTTSFECVCKKGWDGLFCSEPMCKEGCHQTRGYCEYPGECRCRLGWAGPTCHSCQVLPGCVHGSCTKPLECKCDTGYRGFLCQSLKFSVATVRKKQWACGKWQSLVCLWKSQNAAMHDHLAHDHLCRVGWWGKDCTKCFPYPGCKNGTCRRPWECNCLPGWGGMLCDEALDFCDKNPSTCTNGGKCLSLTKDDGSFRCECPSGFRGDRCEIAPTTTDSPKNTTQAESTEAMHSSTEPIDSNDFDNEA
uniref:Putative teneurin-1 n=1 Tax=Lutzomyia longipalpis TaxID=7200 RepID=A0A1B0CG55_LUTLO